MTTSIRNFMEYGNTNPATLLITISTKPSASNQRRGRISFQTSGKTVLSLWIFGGFAASIPGELNLLFDSVRRDLASLLLHCHTSAARPPPCDTHRPNVVCSGRVPPVSAGPFSDPWPAVRPAHYPVRRSGIFGLHHTPSHWPAQIADGISRPQP